MEKLFRIDPITVRAKDGSDTKLIIEHRVGSQLATFGRADLFKRVGLEAEYFDTCLKLEKKFRDRDLFNKLSDKILSGEKRKLDGWIRNYKHYLELFYKDQGLLPLVGFVPVPAKNGEVETVLFIQAMVSIETSKLMVGEVNDLALWSEATAVWSKPIADKHNDAIKVAKMILKLPHVNKDIQSRMSLVVSGDVSRAGLLEYTAK